MILWHWTLRKNLESIMRDGLKPSGLGIVYLTPAPDLLIGMGDALLEVETHDLKLTAFEDCTDWEVLCWGAIKPENIKFLGVMS